MSLLSDKHLSAQHAGQWIQTAQHPFTLIQNPPYVFPPYELCPMAPAATQLADGVEGIVMDMDGTTTTTEVLCIESLAKMTMAMAGESLENASASLDPVRDYPNIIGNSTTKHVEYLIQTYGARFQKKSICWHFIESTAWTLSQGMDEMRKKEALNSQVVLGLASLQDDPDWQALLSAERGENRDRLLSNLTDRYLSRLTVENLNDQSRAGIEIYYRHYHETLAVIEEQGGCCSATGKAMIDPMPAIGITLALLKGWLGADLALLRDMLVRQLQERDPDADMSDVLTASELAQLGRYFEKHPVKLALVTSSIASEATIVLREVFRVLQSEMKEWPLADARKETLIQAFQSPDKVYDAQITASDSSEIRLKPHRDLYSVALHSMGIGPDAFHKVAGFEDSESGTIAIRTAGIPLCCALPFAMTKDHRFEAASLVCQGGLPEVILKHNFFLPLDLTGSL